MVAGTSGARRIPFHAQGRSRARRSLCFHAKRPRARACWRRYPGGFCIPGAYRSGASVRGRKSERADAKEMGKKLLETEARHFGRSLKKIPEAELLKFASDHGLAKIEDLYASVGFGKLSASQILARVLGENAKEEESEIVDSTPTIVKTVKRMLGFGEA